MPTSTTRVVPGIRPTSSGATQVRKLAVSRKARTPRVTRLESGMLLALVVGLSLLVFVGVSGATRDSSVAVCNADVSAVSSGIAVVKAEGFSTPTSQQGWERGLLGKSEFGGPLLSAWPSDPLFSLSIAGVGAPADSGDGVTPANGDILVRVSRDGKVFDATVRPTLGCAAVA
jgi:hypothetical protein